MARRESAREDLLREATAYRLRAELRTSDANCMVFAGWRDDGSLSLFFGDDPVYHFDPQCCLRRAFVDGEMFASRGDTLARLTRHRTAGAVELRRRDLSPAELQAFVRRMQTRLKALSDAVAGDRVEIRRQVPDNGPIYERLRAALPRAADGQLAAAVRRGSRRE